MPSAALPETCRPLKRNTQKRNLVTLRVTRRRLNQQPDIHQDGKWVGKSVYFRDFWSMGQTKQIYPLHSSRSTYSSRLSHSQPEKMGKHAAVECNLWVFGSDIEPQKCKACKTEMFYHAFCWGQQLPLNMPPTHPLPTIRLHPTFFVFSPLMAGSTADCKLTDAICYGF